MVVNSWTTLYGLWTCFLSPLTRWVLHAHLELSLEHRSKARTSGFSIHCNETIELQDRPCPRGHVHGESPKIVRLTDILRLSYPAHIFLCRWSQWRILFNFLSARCMSSTKFTNANVETECRKGRKSATNSLGHVKGNHSTRTQGPQRITNCICGGTLVFLEFQTVFLRFIECRIQCPYGCHCRAAGTHWGTQSLYHCVQVSTYFNYGLLCSMEFDVWCQWFTLCTRNNSQCSLAYYEQVEECYHLEQHWASLIQ